MRLARSLKERRRRTSIPKYVYLPSLRRFTTLLTVSQSFQHRLLILARVRFLLARRYRSTRTCDSTAVRVSSRAVNYRNYELPGASCRRQDARRVVARRAECKSRGKPR